MTAHAYHVTTLGRFGSRLRADLDGYVYEAARDVLSGRWPHAVSSEDAEAVAAHNRREGDLALAALRAWRDGHEHWLYYGRDDSPAYVYQRCDDARLEIHTDVAGKVVFAFLGTDRDTGCKLDAAGPIDGVGALASILTEYAPADYDCSSLPTFGGVEPDCTVDVYSWDATHILTGPDQWEPVPRDEWERAHG